MTHQGLLMALEAGEHKFRNAVEGEYDAELLKRARLALTGDSDEAPRQYPTEDAYMRACRALHWATAQLRANGIEPHGVPADAPHYPPDDYDFGAKHG